MSQLQPHYPLYTNVTFHDFIILIPDLVAFSQALQGGKSEGDKEEKKDEKKDDKDDKKKDEPEEMSLDWSLSTVLKLCVQCSFQL